MTKGTIVAAQPEAAEAGAVILREGGNVVDAAIASALVQGVVDPQQCGIAGFGSLQLYLPERGVHTCIDFHAKAPAATRPDMWEALIEKETLDGFGFVLRDRVNDVGYQSIAVPGSLKAYYETQLEFGTMPWSEIVAPAIAHAEAGVRVRPHMNMWWNLDDKSGRIANRERMAFSKYGREIYFDDYAMPLATGEILHNPDMATTLKRIAAHGADIFYKGEIAREMVADIQANGGLISLEDLADYRTSRYKPLKSSYRGLELATNRPPGGGMMLVEMLNVLEHFDLAVLGHNSADYIRIVAEAMKYATIDKDRFLGDPAFFDVPYEKLMGKPYAEEIAARIRNGEKASVERYAGDGESKFTTHVGVVDDAGNAVTMTHSLGTPSGVITEGLGFMYNGCMSVFDPRPGRAGSLAPGKSRFSSIAPSILFRDGAPQIVIGAPGGTQIAMGILQVLLNIIDHGMSPVEAVYAPRFSGTYNTIEVCNRIPGYLTDVLRDNGYEIRRLAESYTFSGVHVIAKNGSEWHGGADPGYDGVALTV